MLFADIVGFTKLAESLDPEDVKHLIDRCFERLAKDITSFGGVVDKILGDGVVALFGAPVAHEDDAERAVRAGLRMQQTVLNFANEISGPVQMRVGLNTGEVLVGMSSAGGDYTAMGDVMNIASRLESAAQPGQVLVGTATQQATQDAIAYRHLGTVEARGRAGAVEGWVALSAVRPPGLRRRRETSFVGRDYEMSLLEAQARMAVENRRAQAAVVLGESGMGKSRVAEESAALVARTWNGRVLQGRSVPYGEANVWWPVAELLRHAFHLDIETSADEARAAILGGLSVHLAASRSADIPRITTALMHALGYQTSLRGGDRERNRSEISLALVSVLEAELQNRPLVLLMSDVHWAGDAVMGLIEHLLNELLRYPLIIIMTAKASEPPRPLAGRHGSLVLHLGPLEPKASAAILDDLGLDLSRVDTAQLVERSGGNPFFLEELASLMIGREGAPSEQLPSGGLASLPDTLRGIISARLDALDSQARTVLEAAAVLGRSGPIDGLEIMISRTRPLEDFNGSLATLVDEDLLKFDGPRYEFRSDMVREVAYATLTKTARALSHHGIAEYLEQMGGSSDRNSTIVPIADHYRAAAELLNDLAAVPGIDHAETAAKAVHWLGVAGSRALDAGVPLEAERWFTAGLESAVDDETRGTFLYGRARARSELRNIAGARKDLELLEPIAAFEPSLAARALLESGELDRKAGDFDRAAARLREAADRLEALGDHEKQASALRLLGMTELLRGDAQLARQALESARNVASGAGDSRSEAWALQGLAWHAFQSGDLPEASRLVDEAVRIFTSLDDRGGLSWARGLDAWVAFHAGDWERARRVVDEVMPDTHRRGDPWAEAVMLNLSASLELWSGHASRAAELSEEAREAGLRADDVGMQIQSQAIGGRAMVSLGRVAEGTIELERAFAAADQVGNADARRMAVVSITASAARIGDPERAIRWAARFDGGHQNPDFLGESDLAVSLALALLQRGAVEEAASQLAWIDSGPDDPDMFAQSVGAVVAAAQGQTEIAERRVRAVLDGSATYLDQVTALLARAALACKRGDTLAAESAISDARLTLSITDDRVTPLLVDLVAAICRFGSVEHVEVRFRGLGMDPSGWRRAWELATAGAVQA